MPSAVTIVWINLYEDLRKIISEIAFFQGYRLYHVYIIFVFWLLISCRFLDMLFPSLHTEITYRKELIKDWNHDILLLIILICGGDDGDDFGHGHARLCSSVKRKKKESVSILSGNLNLYAVSFRNSQENLLLPPVWHTHNPDRAGVTV